VRACHELSAGSGAPPRAAGSAATRCSAHRAAGVPKCREERARALDKNPRRRAPGSNAPAQARSCLPPARPCWRPGACPLCAGAFSRRLLPSKPRWVSAPGHGSRRPRQTPGLASGVCRPGVGPGARRAVAVDSPLRMAEPARVCRASNLNKLSARLFWRLPPAKRLPRACDDTRANGWPSPCVSTRFSCGISRDTRAHHADTFSALWLSEAPTERQKGECEMLEGSGDSGASVLCRG